MKLGILSIVFLFITPDHYITTYHAECVNINDKGVVTLLIWDIEEGKKYKPEQAEKDAVAYILYQGFAGGTCGYVSALLKSTDAKHAFDDTELYFFKGSKGYSNYVTESNISEVRTPKVRDDDWKIYEVTVNKKALDEYLVEKEIKSEIDIY